jgi:DNA-directed RNA polymerase specialized sigma subunit
VLKLLEKEMTGLEWLAANYKRVYKAACKAAKNNVQHTEELMGVAVDRVDGIAATWDVNKRASLTTHMLVNLKWYFFKYRNKVRKRAMSELSDNISIESLSIEARDERDALMARLNETEQWLVSARHEYEMTFSEMSECLGYSKNTVITMYRKAMEKLCP